VRESRREWELVGERGERAGEHKREWKGVGERRRQLEEGKIVRELERTKKFQPENKEE